MSASTVLPRSPLVEGMPRVVKVMPRDRRGFFEGCVRRGLGLLRGGRLILRTSAGVEQLGDGEGPVAEIEVLDPRFWPAFALRGSIGAAEAWVMGWWTSPDLAQVVRLVVRGRAAIDRIDGGLARWMRPFLALRHGLSPNTRPGSRRNVAAHYDLSNEFFRTFLDPTMTYSCGIFEREDSSLQEASIAKLDRICRKLGISPGDRVVEIGTGWGSFALHAAGEYGARVTTTTISAQQHRLATERIRAAGLTDRVEVLSLDYRDLPRGRGGFDHLVSVEMIEAVGHRGLEPFFGVCGDLLAPHGRMLMQAITIADTEYHRARRGVDFIQRYVFPGSVIPSTTRLCAAATAASDLRLVHLEDLTPHYARTLAEWRRNLLDARGDLATMGFDEAFVRLFEYYFAYCEGGFAERYLGDVHLVFARPGSRHEPILPPLSPVP